MHTSTHACTQIHTSMYSSHKLFHILYSPCHHAIATSISIHTHMLLCYYIIHFNSYTPVTLLSYYTFQFIHTCYFATILHISIHTHLLLCYYITHFNSYTPVTLLSYYTFQFIHICYSATILYISIHTHLLLCYYIIHFNSYTPVTLLSYFDWYDANNSSFLVLKTTKMIDINPKQKWYNVVQVTLFSTNNTSSGSCKLCFKLFQVIYH